MPEVTTPQAQSQAPVQTPNQSSAPSKGPMKKKDGKKKMVKRLIALGVTAAILFGAGFGVWYLVFRNDSTTGKPLSQEAQIGTIQSTVQGNGSAVPKESASITLSAAGTVQEVFVTVGQQVMAGDPLYTIDSQDARDKLQKAQENLDKLYKDMADLQEDAANLTVRVPFAGKLQDVKEFQPDQEVGKEAPVATLVNDKKLKLSLYFSYAYEKDIKVGQSVNVSIPAVMKDYKGTVEKINKVSYISPEGAVHFEAVIVFDNPGTLTAGMDASAVLTAADGTSIYPYQNGKTEFYETRNIVTKAGGPVVSVGNLLNHANVSAGEALLTLGSSTIDADIRAKQEQINTAQKELENAQKGIANFNAVAPIDGVVFSCALEPGQTVKEGETVITISNTTTMLVDIQVDNRNIGFIKAGMTMELTDQATNTPYTGTVTKVAMQGEVGSGMTTYPVQLSVDNFDNSLTSGSWLSYKLVTSESVDCVTVPNQSVRRVTDVDGNIHTVVFVEADSKPENAIEIAPSTPQEGTPEQQNTMPTPEEGFWPVPVTIGISDTYNVEIKDGIEAGTPVFTNRETDQSAGW
ncbi:HlyD family efflux transporter periplasmic adaptor subunit [Pseudoflavonifractor sp. AF19-9AC]|uniref:HlyD family efflux transporter periplasmic adaptor subunit n=1 Tax=Pseudoflavonifractor sp. AF19-9AC TaxID=2292244 RepID=UPI001314144F|nr:HlyD family efflux transporter periplasmic adaptor subunit [Pseudoflavonifractor sp. AF19-9AC]